MRHVRAVKACLLAVALLAPATALAADGPGMSTDLVRTMLLLTLLAVAPAIFISMTSFVRIVVVLAMVRHAFGMPETPPNPVLISLALFLTAFTMGPTLTAVNSQALKPLMAGSVTVEQAIEKGSGPLRNFMLAQTRDSDIEAIYAIAKAPVPDRPEQVDLLKLTPAFILNELRVSFTIGFVILLPFLLIDLVVASILLALGMMMVPPSTISLPIKILMFVLIDGWGLILQGVLGSFR
ncbi:flagellar type III secretion system pore protein FliP [Nostoc ellipsosporum NOK]|uniref:flagellar type III secretion system pore protein FliP n=1 Tax=Sphingomonas sp. IBVSS2 TaxID=1985172 RepID=UPI0015C5199F|nr:flagellar type III secretion system pore protein FliP [Sphingomonas sp. IBVSS2]MDF2385684.1 flagellar type III secretion system pore protein FliP [Nostoc ellipsosporum NOK]